MSKDKRIRAVIGKKEMRLPSITTAELMQADGLLFEGWETYYEVTFGVMPGYDLQDLEEWLTTGLVSKPQYSGSNAHVYMDMVERGY